MMLCPEEASNDAEFNFSGRHERLGIALDAANVGTWDWNIRTGEVRWSDNLERIHGQERGAFKRTFEGFLDGVHPDDREAVLKAIQQAVAAGEKYEIEYRSLRPNGAAMWFEGRGRVFRDQAGEPIWMSGICMDTTERHQLQERLRQSQRLESLGVLAGGIAHDYNNLLTSILGNASLAETKLSREDPATPLLKNVVSACLKAADLTRQLLTYAGKGHVRREHIDIVELTRDMLPVVRTFIPSRVELRLELTPAPIIADARQIQQLITNLIVNATEAISGVGAIVVTSGVEEVRVSTPSRLQPGLHACLRVRDTGCGMDEATLGRIFDPFFSTKFYGRGLGLAAVHGIVQTHKGSIDVESTPGGGTTVTVWLPVDNLLRTDLQGPVAAINISARGVILVVDDDDTSLELARTALDAEGYAMLPASDAPSAICAMAIAGDRIRAVVLDLTLLGISSEGILLQFWEMRPTIPVIITSRYGESEIMRLFEDARFSGFLQKPYTAKQLVHCIVNTVTA